MIFFNDVLDVFFADIADVLVVGQNSLGVCRVQEKKVNQEYY